MAGLPRAQMEKKLRMEESIRSNSGEVNSVTKEPIVLSILPTTPPAVVPVENESVSETQQSQEVEPAIDYKAEHEATLKRYKSLQGVISHLEPKARASEERVVELESELRKLTESLQSAKSVPDISDDITEEELAIYGQSSPFIQKLSRQEYRKLEKESRAQIADVQQQIKELKASQQQIGRDLATTTTAQFVATVRANVKNFNEIISSQTWADYGDKRIPYTQLTVADALDNAHKNRDLDRIIEIFNDFKPANSTLRGMASPAISGSASPISSSNQKATLKISDRRALSDEFRKGRILKPEFDKALAEFAQADKEGRVDYTS